MKKKLTCVDLFCGAGGFSRGFLDAGYDVVLGVDYDDAALKTFQMNHGNTCAMKLDLFDSSNIEKIVQYLENIGIEDLDVLVGGPPCQGFSYAGKMEIDDKRNFLYLAMVKLTAQLRPKAVLIENVLALVEAHGGIGAKRIIKDFEDIGYKDLQGAFCTGLWCSADTETSILCRIARCNTKLRISAGHFGFSPLYNYGGGY